MRTPSVESFYSSRSRRSSHSASPPPQSISHHNPKQGVPISNTSTSHYVGELNMLCQVLGLCALYEIDGDQHTGFGGHLKLGDKILTREERWSTKKAAKEGLAQKGIDVARVVQAEKASPAGLQENWIHMLHEFHQGSRGGGGPVFTEYNIGSMFASTCLIPLHPTPFGSEMQPYPNKKAARTNAARQAMDFLISLGFATPDGKPVKNAKSVKEGKKTISKRSPKAEAIASVIQNQDASFVQRVNEICPLLGISHPEYRLTAKDSSLLYSGSAYFRHEPLLPEPIGEVQNIFGKKHAKEECARGVWKVLTALAARRGLATEEAIDDHLP